MPLNLICQDSPCATSAQLAAINGLSPGTHVLLRLESGRALAEIIIACWERGLVAVPVDPRTTEAQYQFIRKHSESSVVITHDDIIYVNEDPWMVYAQDLGHRFLVYTSGSTAAPKGVMLSKDAVEHNAFVVATMHGFGPGIVHATCLPLHHCNALCLSLMGTYLTGGTLLLVPRYDASYFDMLDVAGADTASIVPAMLQQQVEHATPWPESLRYLITAAAPLTSFLAGKFFDLYGPRIRQGYGLTEAVNFSFVMPLLQELDFTQEYVKAHPPVGVPVLGTQVRFTESGEVELRGPNQMSFYWKNTQETAATVTKDGWLRTGDLGEMRGKYLVLKGRCKEVINRGGITIYPVDVEEALEQAGLHQPFAAMAVPNVLLGDDIGLQVPGQTSATVLGVLRKMPRAPGVVTNAPMPVTATGKPQRRKMAEGLFSVHESAAYYTNLLYTAKSVAQRMMRMAGRTNSDSAKFVLWQSALLVRTNCDLSCPDIYSTIVFPAVLRALKLMESALPELLEGLTGEELLKRDPGLWTALMKEWPMGAYAQMAARFLISNDLLGGKVLELGAGVGNTTELVQHLCGDEYLRTDLHHELLGRVAAPGGSAAYDFDTPCPWSGFNTIFGVNALHCAVDRRATLGYLYDALAPDGVLVLGEGAPETTSDGASWALTPLFGLFTGWWDRGGFVAREVWLADIEAAGFHEWGYSVMRAGRHDLGGLVWARK